MDEQLEQIYDDSHGLLNRQLLYQRAKAINPNFTHTIVNEWFNRQRPQIMIQRPRKKKNLYHPIISDGTDYRADILALSTTQKQIKRNGGFIGILTFINSSTRYLRVYPIKSHSFTELMPLVKQFIEEAGDVGSITTDNEFVRGSKARSIFGVPIFLEEPGVHSKLGIVNRVHRTIRDMLRTYSLFTGITKWIEIIGDVVWLYNNDMKHSTIKNQPAKMTAEDVKNLNKRLLVKGIPARLAFDKFRIGDWVRHIVDRKTFHKGPPRFSNDEFMIIDVDGNSFTLWNDDGPAPRTYRHHELRKVPN